MAQGAHKASVQVREELLRHLGAPLGSVVIARRPLPSGEDVIVVRMTASNVVPPNRRTAAFQGFHVDYEVITPSKLGGW
jgi:hypothetical protein